MPTRNGLATGPMPHNLSAAERAQPRVGHSGTARPPGGSVRRRIMAILDREIDNILRPSNHLFPDTSADNPRRRKTRA